MIKISATILTFNEERRIGECLESLRDIADEIIVVDSFSTDSTLDICRAHGCRISQRRMAGFGAQRQYATSLASHTYVLSIDADEVLSPTLRQSLMQLKASTPSHRVYAFSRLNFYCGFAVRHCGWYPDVQVRLFDKRFANWDLSDICERVIFRDSVTPELLEGDLIHNRCDTPREYSDKLHSIARIAGRRLAGDNRSTGALTATLHAVTAFLDTYVAKRGFLDGSVGLALARHNFTATRQAYAESRHL
ncbi:MAG: glycosyltransferase family 2 protein [Bacteroides sp.]|nr:glycosyltransferase family 2 protein [Bacteroides sp.]MCM1413863.1 glycosyltransferase family 2 protein [Bacteroides sp.]MCM1471028.1 glycosyltransferase family 2 protein [Bacteroides sp.]